MGEVHHFPDGYRTKTSVDPPAGGGDEGDMEARVAKLESLAERTSERLGGIEVRLAKLETRAETFCTKEDLHRELHATTWKIVGAIVLAQLLPALPGMLRALKLIT